MADDYGATVNEWVNVIRRARLDRTTKLVALTAASYANPDGTRIYPGVARLVVQCRIGYGTCRRALANLRSAGLLERTRRGGRGRSAEYRLILAPDLLERCDVPGPDQERADIQKVLEANRARSTERSRLADLRSSRRAQKDRSALTFDSQSALTTDPPPSIETSPDGDPPPVEVQTVEPVEDRYARARETDDAMTRRVWTTEETAAARDEATKALDEWTKQQQQQRGDTA